MDLEEHSIETLTDRCQSCGATLTDAEKEAALERSDGLVLCTTCLAERVPVEEDDLSGEEV